MKKKARAAKPKKKSAKKPAFYVTGTRSARGVERTPLHILITVSERAKLIKLTHQMKLNAAGVVRALITAAKLASKLKT